LFTKRLLDNGLRVMTAPMMHTKSVCISIFVGTGSRYEDPEKAGISHFIEHMVFKGTERRPTPKEISEVIEGVGGVLNGATDREYTVYWCKVARPHFEGAMDLLLDMLHNSRIEPQDLEKERGVVVEELNMVQDSPYELVELLIDKVMWPDHPLGRDIGGTKDTVNALRRDDVIGYLEQQYVPSNMVISVAGAVTEEEVISAIGSSTINWRHSPRIRGWYPAVDSQRRPKAEVNYRRSEQSHFCLAVRGLSSVDPDHYALDLLNVIFGEGMSSRLFLEIRDKRGLAYDIHSYISHFLDSGAVVVYAGVDPSNINPAISAVLEQVGLIKEGLSEEELTKAKEISKGRLLLRMEDTRSVSGWMGGQEILLDRALTVDEVVEQVDAVSAGDVRRVSNILFVPEKLNLAVVGPYRGSNRFKSLLRL